MENTRWDRVRRRLTPLFVGAILTSGYAVRASARETEDEDTNNFKEDVLWCEEAVAHVIGCCGSSVQGDACRFHHYRRTNDCGCDTPGTDGVVADDTWPVLATEESKSLAATNCEELKRVDERGSSMCSRLQKRLNTVNEAHVRVERSCR